tara:strand:- start:37 stop:420 length:384 start_codon:yes stop_codon:yes gene_type:complete
MRLTKNFTKREFKSKDGSKMPIEVLENVKELALNLQVLRDFLGEPLRINSAYRSEAHNKSVGGSSRSQHLLGKASDLRVKGLDSEDLYHIIEALINEGKIKEGGLGLYSSFVHYDIRGTRARWNFKK